jgi:hypothetical protein
MPRLSGAAAPPALQPRARAAAGAAAAAAALAVPAPATQRIEAPAPTPAPAPAPAPAVTPRVRAATAPTPVPPPPKNAFLNEPRLYRQPDGSLGATKPPPDPYTVVRSALVSLRPSQSAEQRALRCVASHRIASLQAARRAWADLVRYAQVHGGDTEATAGRSYRYGVGVSYAEHVAYLRSIGIEPERTADGAWIGYDPTKEDPLAAEDHPFSVAACAAAE